MKHFNKHYLYRYIREDTNSVFYVGIGTKHSEIFYTHRQEYRRAYNLHNRNKFFKNICSKTAIHLEIIMESNDYNFIKNKEVEFISLYGLKVNGGTLCNITNGGEGGCGRVLSEKELLNLSTRMTGGKNPTARKVINTKTGKIYESASEASKDYEFSYDSLLKKLSGHKRNNSHFIYLDKYNEGYLPDNVESLHKKKVINVDTGKIFDSVKDCANYYKKSSSLICLILKNKIPNTNKQINIKYYGTK